MTPEPPRFFAARGGIEDDTDSHKAIFVAYHGRVEGNFLSVFPSLNSVRTFHKLSNMSTQTELKLAKWPFFVGNVLLLALAYFIYAQHGRSPMSFWISLLFLGAGTIGSFISVLPFLLEYRTAVKMVETGAVISTISQIKNLEEIGRQIGVATSQWQGVQEHSARTVGVAKELAQNMATEAAAFGEFLKKANDSEKANLRLEVEKMRRAEGEWLQIIVRMLDHTYALHQAAVRSGQPGLIEQLGNFQNACRDVARRIGLVAFAPAVNDRFDSKCHESPDSQAISMPDARIREVIASGFTYQGKMLRPALVSLLNPVRTSETAETSTAEAAEANDKEAKSDEDENLEEQTLL